MFGTLVERLRNGVPDTELSPAFEPLSVSVYAIVGTMLAGGVIAAGALGFAIPLRSCLVIAMFAYFALVAMLLRRLGHPKLSTGMETLVIVYGQGLAGLFLLIPGGALGFPLADGLLDGWDRVLGLDWRAYAFGVRPFLPVLWPAYASFHLQGAILVAVLAWQGRLARCWRLATAGALALLITALIFPFFPAVGAFAYHGIMPADYPPMTAHSTPFNFVPALLKLRGGYRIIDASVAKGIVSFPSYHAACAALFTWAAWPLRYVRGPVLVLNAMLLLGTPIFGSHYFVDVLAGVGVAVASLWIVSRLVPEGPVSSAH